MQNSPRRRNSRYGYRSQPKYSSSVPEAFSLFFQEISNGFLIALKKLIIDLFVILIKNPTLKAWDEIQVDKHRRPDLDGLKNIRKHKADYGILVFTVLIICVGLVVMYSLSPQRAIFLNKNNDAHYSTYFFFFRHLINIGVGLVFFIIAKNTPITFIYRHSGKFLIIGYILCILLAIMGKLHIPLADCKLGACRWYNLGLLSFQPAELLKVGLMISLAVFLGAKASLGKVNDWKETILPSGILVLLMIIIVAGFQNDLGTTLSALAIIAFQFFVAGINKANIRIFLTILGVLIITAIAIAPHRISRIATFMNTDCSNLASKEAGDDYHICHAKIAIGSGGILGLGLGNSVQATGYLPEVINDSVFAVMSEMFGFIWMTLILLLFVALIYRLLKVSAYSENPASRILSAGAAGWFSIHTIINIFAMTGLAPLTGITMPLVSYGGTSIVFIMIVLGLAFNVSSYTNHSVVKDINEEDKNENSRSRRRLRGTRSTHRSSF